MPVLLPADALPPAFSASLFLWAISKAGFRQASPLIALYV
jgi:hypothetical protein